MSAGGTVVRGRYAPSPTGRLHLGNVRTALAAWLSVRAQDGTFVWRVEDLDEARAVSGLADAAMDDLRWLGMDWDEGPDVGGPHAPYRQSARTALYEEALARLMARGRLFPCRLSRKDLQDLASAPHGMETSPYPAELRPKDLAPGWFQRLMKDGDAAVRFMVHDRTVRFNDLVEGEVEERVSAAVGDFVLRRRDGVYAYQLAVVVDDIAMNISEVVRGRDLLDSTARQIQLIEALDVNTPSYAHVPLVLNAAGEKLSKRDAYLTLEAFRAAGILPQQVTGYLGWSLGLLPEPRNAVPRDLVENFSWQRVRREDWRLPADVLSALRTVG